MKYKRCYVCKQTKPIDEFGKNKTKKDGLRAECKICHRINDRIYKQNNRKKILKKKKQYRLKNKDKIRKYDRKYRLKKKFGLTIDDYNEMLKKQNNKCCICKADQKSLNTSLAVDHCHKTGKIRGLLCEYCNRRLLPLLEYKYPDNYNIVLTNAKIYLERGLGLYR